MCLLLRERMRYFTSCKLLRDSSSTFSKNTEKRQSCLLWNTSSRHFTNPNGLNVLKQSWYFQRAYRKVMIRHEAAGSHLVDPSPFLPPHPALKEGAEDGVPSADTALGYVNTKKTPPASQTPRCSNEGSNGSFLCCAAWGRIQMRRQTANQSSPTGGVASIPGFFIPTGRNNRIHPTGLSSFPSRPCQMWLLAWLRCQLFSSTKSFQNRKRLLSLVAVGILTGGNNWTGILVPFLDGQKLGFQREKLWASAINMLLWSRLFTWAGNSQNSILVCFIIGSCSVMDA